MAKEEKDTLLTAANILTSLRIFLVPVFLAMILSQKAIQALVVFLVAGSTDLLDGITARLYHQKTRFGAFLDPTADKLLGTSAFIVLTLPSLASPNSIPLWLTATVIGRDLLIGIGVLILYRLRGHKQFNPTLLGKATTFCQLTVILLVLFLNSIGISSPFLRPIFRLTLLITLLSTIHYTYVGLRILSAAR